MNGITSLLFDFTFSHVSCEDRLMRLCCESRASEKAVGAHLDFRDLLSLILMVHVQLVLVCFVFCYSTGVFAEHTQEFSAFSLQLVQPLLEVGSEKKAGNKVFSLTHACVKFITMFTEMRCC